MITSHTTVTNMFRLVNPETHEERNFQVRDMHVSLWDDQIVSIAWVNPKGRSTGKYLVAVNHSTKQQFYNDTDIKLVLLRRPLGGMMMLYIFFDIWNLWQLVLMAVYARTLKSRVKAFKRTGVEPLVGVMNKAADRIANLPQQSAPAIRSAPATSTTVISESVSSSNSPAFCSKCGASINSDAKFCPACGSIVLD